MSKGNMLLGYARGSVGDVVFSRLKGQQISKARNRKPNNPKTMSQMAQRSLFICAVKFYQLARRKFFRFAFEDKKTNESDFNAFMRHNVAAGTNMSQASFQAYNYPALGDFKLTQGSLQPFITYSNSNTFYARTGIIVPSDVEAPTTVGALSQLLTTIPRYQQGDLITYVDYQFNVYNDAAIPAIEVDNDNYLSSFNFYQLKLDSEDSSALSNYGLRAEIIEAGRELVIASSGDAFDETYRALALIQSRQLDSGLLVSDSRFLMSGLYQEAMKAAQDEQFIQKVLTSWNSTEEAILSPRSVV